MVRLECIRKENTRRGLRLLRFQLIFGAEVSKTVKGIILHTVSLGDDSERIIMDYSLEDRRSESAVLILFHSFGERNRRR